ncbi:MAG: hypothetical protein IJL17_17960 [Kiritimatiellae bacterium]|nr:hypothetical protein [Kiritimatiellia bacterium]
MESRHLGGYLGEAALSPLHPVGRAVPASRPPYCTSTTTLKNRIAALSLAVAPSTAFHSPSSVAAPCTTARAPGTFHCAYGCSKTIPATCGEPSARGFTALGRSQSP